MKKLLKSEEASTLAFTAAPISAGAPRARCIHTTMVSLAVSQRNSGLEGVRKVQDISNLRSVL